MSFYDFSLSYQKSPIIFVGGVAGNIQPVPIAAYTEGLYFPQGVVANVTGLELDKFQFDFEPVPGSALVQNQVAMYPFANQSVAANAIISEPLQLSMLMRAPPRLGSSWELKQQVITRIKGIIDSHTALGGTYNVATPSYLYQNLILISLTDQSAGDPRFPQSIWRWDFVQPLLTESAALAAQNVLLQKISSQTQVLSQNGAVYYSGQGTGTGYSSSGQGPALIPFSEPLAGASVFPPSSPTAPSKV